MKGLLFVISIHILLKVPEDGLLVVVTVVLAVTVLLVVEMSR